MAVNEQPLEIRIPMPWGYIAGCWYGDRHSRPLLAMHGWQDNAGSFARLAPLIAPHRAVLSIDLPGHGRSSHFAPGIHYHAIDYVCVIHRIIKYYKWQRVSLMAHSMSASICFYYTAVCPLMVDMMIAIDVLQTRYFEPRLQIAVANHIIEKLVVGNERLLKEQFQTPDPPIYKFDRLEQLLHEGSEFSVELEHCKHILERSVTRSEKHPDEYYFTRDARVKYFFETYMEAELTVEMAKRIRNVNYMVLKAEHSHHLTAVGNHVMEVLRANNPCFEYHELPNTKHHLHLNNPEQLARYIVPFVLKHSQEAREESTSESEEEQKSKL